MRSAHPFTMLAAGACLYNADSREVLRQLPADCLDSCVTDPPYELTQANRRKPPPHVEGSPFSRHRVGVNGDNKPVGGFMGKEWDGTGTTGRAAVNKGFKVVLIEREAEYAADIARRFA